MFVSLFFISWNLRTFYSLDLEALTRYCFLAYCRGELGLRRKDVWGKFSGFEINYQHSNYISATSPRAAPLIFHKASHFAFSVSVSPCLVIEIETVNMVSIHHAGNVFLKSQNTVTHNTLLDQLCDMLHLLAAARTVRDRKILELKLGIDIFLKQCIWAPCTCVAWEHLKALTFTKSGIPSKHNADLPLIIDKAHWMSPVYVDWQLGASRWGP